MIVCSDYDRTFKVDQQISTRNLLAVKELRRKGHLFVINTGRTYQGLKEENEQHPFEFDYAICGSGSQIINQRYQLIHQTTFDKEFVKPVLDKLVESSATLIQYSHQYQWKVLRKNPDNEWEHNLFEHFPQQLNTMSCRFQTINEAKQFYDSFRFNVNAFLNYYSIDMVASSVDKAHGLHQLVRQLGVNPAEVFVVGDGLNDLPMLLQFNGAVVEHGQEAVKEHVKKNVSDVAALIEEVLQKTVG